jgi:hypothetical protein
MIAMLDLAIMKFEAGSRAAGVEVVIVRGPRATRSGAG